MVFLCCCVGKFLDLLPHHNHSWACANHSSNQHSWSGYATPKTDHTSPSLLVIFNNRNTFVLVIVTLILVWMQTSILNSLSTMLWYQSVTPENRNGGNVLGWRTSCQVSQHMQYSNQSTTTIELIVKILHRLHLATTIKCKIQKIT